MACQCLSCFHSNWLLLTRSHCRITPAIFRAFDCCSGCFDKWANCSSQFVGHKRFPLRLRKMHQPLLEMTRSNSLLQIEPSVSLAIFQQCRASKIADTKVPGGPPPTQPDTSNKIPVSGAHDIILLNDTGEWHHIPESVDDDDNIDRHWYIRY